MKICQEHWAMCRESIDSRGMGGLVAPSGEVAVENMCDEIQGGKPPFDPLMSMNWHWTNAALSSGGIYLMTQNPEAADGHYCPLCELAKHAKGFDASTEISRIADQILDYCRDENLVPRPA